MSRHTATVLRASILRRFAVGAALLVAAGVSFANTPARAQAADPAEARRLVEAHLRGGEFGPARAIAAQAATPEARDGLLRRVAVAQAAAGARRASLSTAGGILDDRVRAGALDHISHGPIGNWLGGADGGGAQADFTQLIELITDTVANPTWEDNGGPVGAQVKEFRGGVYVDAAGLLTKIPLRTNTDLAALRTRATAATDNRNPRRKSSLRKVSLTRLEKYAQLRWAAGLEPDEAMTTLAGLHAIQYVLVYPESGDIVLVGPAGDWRANAEGRLVNNETGRPVIQLDDFVVLLRNAYSKDGSFGCSINPVRENLARAKQFLTESSKKPLKPGQRSKWLRQLRDLVGRQSIEVYGIDPRTRAAHVMVEADYRMKLVGMGLEEGTLGVNSYLDSIKLAPGEAPPPMSVLRWWFTLNYKAMEGSSSRDAFALLGQGVKVLSENELLGEQGERVHTGKSDQLNREFARSFTKHFAALSAKYPVYAELNNLFDIALVAALLKSEDLPGQVGWHMTHFSDPRKYRVQLRPAPKEVETVINHRVINRKHIVAGVSGGVSAAPRSLVTGSAIHTTGTEHLEAGRLSAAPPTLPDGAWWWD